MDESPCAEEGQAHGDQRETAIELLSREQPNEGQCYQCDEADGMEHVAYTLRLSAEGHQ